MVDDENAGLLENIADEAAETAARGIVMAVSGGLQKEISGTVSEVWRGFIGDRIQEWRVRNLIEGCAETAKILKKKGVDLSNTRALPNGEIYALFDGMSKADQPGLSELWAGLLASAMDPAASVEANTSYTNVLNLMAPNDAVLMQFIAEYEKNEIQLEVAREKSRIDKNKIEFSKLKQESMNEICESWIALRLTEDASKAATGNLRRLGLVEKRSEWRSVFRPTAANLGDGYTLKGVVDSISEVISRLQSEISEGRSENFEQLAPKVRKFGLFGDENQYSLEMNLQFTSFGKKLAIACDLLNK